ncbi:hypothetical protein D3C75_1317740 [compost metagenome]
MHQDFILYTASRESRQLGSFAQPEAFNGFNQANRPDGDQVLEIFSGVVEFLDDMGD